MNKRPDKATKSNSVPCAAICCAVICVMTACGGSNSGGGSAAGSAALTLGGTVAHLVAGSSVALENIGGDTVTVSSNGSFTFPEFLAGGMPYDVTVSTQPPDATCKVTGGSGTTATANVTSIMVICAPKGYSITGTVAGLLVGRNLGLQDNGGDDTNVSTDSGFLFTTPVASGANYSVTIRTQPAGQNCAVTNGNGTVANADVTTVTINCSDDTYNIGVTVSGLIANGLVLQDNGADNMGVSSNGRFNFNTPIASGSTYAVTILSQPVGETCAIAKGSGRILSSNVSNASVACVPNTYQISGTLSGLLGGASLVLQDNGGNSTTVSSDGTFNFSTAVASATNYAVTVAIQPAAQSCAIADGTGIVVAGNVSNISVACSSNSFNVTATVSGLNNGTLVLQDNGGDNLSILGDGSFNFNTPLASNASYNITILTQPAGENCTLSNASGTVGSSNVTSVCRGMRDDRI